MFNYQEFKECPVEFSQVKIRLNHFLCAETVHT